MAQIDMTSEVAADQVELFDLLADVDNEANWNPDVIEVHRVDSGPLDVGARWQGQYKGMGTMDITLREYQRPDRMAFAITGSRMDMDFAFTLASAGTKTAMRSTADIRPKGLMRVFSPMLGPMMRRTMSKRPAQMGAGVAQRRAAAG